MTAFDVRGTYSVIGTFTKREKAVRFAKIHFAISTEITRVDIPMTEWLMLKFIGR